MAAEQTPEEWEFEKCKKGAGPHGHNAISRRQWLRRGVMIFFWRCSDCGEQSKVAVVAKVNEDGVVL